MAGLDAAAALPPPPDACTPAGSRARGRWRRRRGGAAADVVAAVEAAADGAAPRGLQPGQYSVRLTVDGQSYTQPVTIKPDPRGATAGN